MIPEFQHLNNMKEVFVKKKWEEEHVLFYLHFENNIAVRQIEVTRDSKVFLTAEDPLM